MTDASHRLAVLVASRGDDGAAGAALAEERARIGAVLGDAVRATTVGVPAATNPVAGTGSMMGVSHYAASLEVDVAPGTAPEVLAEAVAGLAGRHHDAIDPERSAVLVGTAHHLRRRPLPPGADPLTVMVAVQAPPGLSPEEAQAGWYEVGQVNARNHPTCSTYAQVHADPGASAAAAAAAGLTDGPLVGLAIEVFPRPDDLLRGHHWAASPESVAGSPIDGPNLMALLRRFIDLSSGRTFLASTTER